MSKDIFIMAAEFTETLRREQEQSKECLYDLEDELSRTPQDRRDPSRLELMEAYQRWLDVTKLCYKYNVTIKG